MRHLSGYSAHVCGHQQQQQPLEHTATPAYIRSAVVAVEALVFAFQLVCGVHSEAALESFYVSDAVKLLFVLSA